MFGPLLAALPSDVWRTVIAHPVDQKCTQRELADRVARELATTGDDLVLVAESYSGVVALHVAATLGPRVRAVVLVASFVANPTPYPRWVADLLPDWAFRRTLPRWLLRFVLLGGEAPGPLVEELCEAIRAVEPAVLAARVREVIRLRADEAPRLERTPVLYVRAAHDRLVSARALDAVRARCERVEVREIEGPHLIAQREPDAVWSAISGWLATVPDAAC